MQKLCCGGIAHLSKSPNLASFRASQSNSDQNFKKTTQKSCRVEHAGFLDHCPAAWPKWASAWGHKHSRTFFFRIPGPIYNSKSSSKTATDHHTTKTINNCWYEMVIFWNAGKMGRVMGHTHSKNATIALGVHRVFFQKYWGIIKMFSGKTDMSLYVLFAKQWS